MAIKNITDESFAKEIRGSKNCLVDFWAPWCGPCRALSPVLDEIAGEMQNTVTVLKVNIDENPETASEFGIRSIPTLVILNDSKEVSRREGGLPKADLRNWINDSIKQ